MAVCLSELENFSIPLLQIHFLSLQEKKLQELLGYLKTYRTSRVFQGDESLILTEFNESSSSQPILGWSPKLRTKHW